MIADLKPYSEVKDSGLPWLGQMPAHWRTVRNGSLFGQRNQTGFAELPILEVSLKTGVQVRAFGTTKRKQVMSDLAKYKRAVKGDLAYNTMRMWQGALGVCPVDGLVSPAYVVARPYAGVEPRYFAALFRTGDYMAYPSIVFSIRSPKLTKARTFPAPRYRLLGHAVGTGVEERVYLESLEFSGRFQVPSATGKS